jgi:hypothetical protein
LASSSFGASSFGSIALLIGALASARVGSAEPVSLFATDPSCLVSRGWRAASLLGTPGTPDVARPSGLPSFAFKFSDEEAATAGDAAKAGSAGPVGKKPLLYSLLLPGLGELSMGEKKRAIGFFVAEGLIWTSFTYWTVAGHLRQDDYIEQASLNAGVGVSSESDDYWRLVGQYVASSGGSGTYEEDLRREARDTYPNDPAAQDALVAERLPTGDRAWSWSSSEFQSAYQETRESSRRAFNRAKYSYAAAILNRVVSVIDVQLLSRHALKESHSTREETPLRVYADALDGGGRLVVQRRF